jgi:carotenoid cleavage dioxygenase-like enzyme
MSQPSRKNLIRSLSKDQEPIEAKVTGVVPDWLNGSLFRNGPGRFRFGDRIYKHLFDGMACVNKFEIVEGRVFFSNKLLKTTVYTHNMKTKRLYSMFGTQDVCSTVFGRLKTFFKRKEFSVYDNANVSIVPFGDSQMYALSETYMAVRIDPQTLEIMNEENLMNFVKPTFSLIGHPHIDCKGNWLSMGLQPLPFNLTYDILKFSANADPEIQNVCQAAKLFARIPSTHKNFAMSYFHSFAMTKNYIVFLEQSLVLNCKKMALNLFINQPVSTALNMNKKFNTRIHLVERATGNLIKHKYFTKPQVSLHQINAYEVTENSKTKILVDVCSYDELDVKDFAYNEDLDEVTEMFLRKHNAQIRRIHIPLSDISGSETFCNMTDLNSVVSIELPTINYMKYNSNPYKYCYGVSLAEPPYTIVKVNVDKPTECIKACIVSDNARILPSEPIFVERPDAMGEDDGVILSLILGDKFDFMVVLDAQTMEEIGRAELPDHVKCSYTFHGFFADRTKYKF